MLQYQADYERMRAILVRLLSMPVARNVSVKPRLNKRRQARLRRFWVRPGRTNAWWTGFVNQIVVPEEQRENFRMSRVSLHRLTEELRPYIEEKDTVMRSSIDPVKQVGNTLYYLSNEGRVRKIIYDGACSQSNIAYLYRFRAYVWTLENATNSDMCGRVNF